MRFLAFKNAVSGLLFVLATTIVFLLPGFQAFSSDVETPEFDVPSEVSTNSGYKKIDWGDNTEDMDLTYQLQQSESKDFKNAKTLYKGKDRATFVSGLPNGNYYYRVRAFKGQQKSDWSNTVVLRVKHYSLKLAFLLAAIGIVVFLLTVYIIIHGVRQQEKQQNLNG